MEVADLPKVPGSPKEAAQGHRMTMFQCHCVPSSATAACSLGLFLFKFCAEKGLNSFVDFVSPVSASPFLWIFFSFLPVVPFSLFLFFVLCLFLFHPLPVPLHLQIPLLLSLFLSRLFSVFLFLVWSF